MTEAGKAPAARTRPPLDPKGRVEKVQRVPPLQIGTSRTAPWAPAPIAATETPAPEKGGSLKTFRTEVEARVKAGAMTREQGDQLIARAQERVRLPFDTAPLSRFGTRTSPFSGASEHHPGVDFKAGSGTNVPAVAEGNVVQYRYMGGLGYAVVVDHGTDAAGNRVYSVYAHNQKFEEEAAKRMLGSRVEVGATLSSSGSSGHSKGPHVHYEVRVVPPGGPNSTSAAFTGKYSVDPQDYVWPDLTPPPAPKH